MSTTAQDIVLQDTTGVEATRAENARPPYTVCWVEPGSGEDRWERPQSEEDCEELIEALNQGHVPSEEILVFPPGTEQDEQLGTNATVDEQTIEECRDIFQDIETTLAETRHLGMEGAPALYKGFTNVQVYERIQYLKNKLTPVDVELSEETDPDDLCQAVAELIFEDAKDHLDKFIHSFKKLRQECNLFNPNHEDAITELLQKMDSEIVLMREDTHDALQKFALARKIRKGDA